MSNELFISDTSQETRSAFDKEEEEKRKREEKHIKMCKMERDQSIQSTLEFKKKRKKQLETRLCEIINYNGKPSQITCYQNLDPEQQIQLKTPFCLREEEKKKEEERKRRQKENHIPWFEVDHLGSQFTFREALQRSLCRLPLTMSEPIIITQEEKEIAKEWIEQGVFFIYAEPFFVVTIQGQDSVITCKDKKAVYHLRKWLRADKL